MNRKSNPTVGTVTIANGGTISTALDLAGRRLKGVVMPAAFTGASIKFQGSVDGVAFDAIYNEATEYSVNVGTNRRISLNSAVFEPWPIVKVVSAGAEAADRVIVLVGDEL